MRHAFRSLAKSPGFTVVALATLALGIGVNTTSFSVLNALLLHTVPYPEPDRLVRVYRTSPQSQRWSHAPANFLDQRAQNSVFDGMAAWQWTNFNLAEPGQPAERLRGMLVSADFFPLLGTAPALGRLFTAEENEPGRDNVIVISHGTWLQRFGGDPDIAGRQLRLNGEPATIVGVMPAAFDDYKLWGDVAAWRPIAFSAETRAVRDSNYLQAMARLKRGVSLQAAQTQMSAIAARLALEYPKNNTQIGLRLMPLGSSIQDDVGRRITWFVVGLSAFVLLIACANLANLQFARNAARSRDHAIRAALGATRGQLVRHVLAESVMLALAGGALSLVLALWTNDLIGRSFTWGDRLGMAIPLDLRVLLFTLLASVATGIGFGLLPAWLAARTDVTTALKQGARGSTVGRSHHRLRHALIVAEIALALALLAGAGFFVRGLQRFMQRDPGWRTDELLTAYVNIRGQRYESEDAQRAFYARLHEQLATLPGVERAAIASSVPTWGYTVSNTFVIDGRSEPPAGRAPLATSAAVTPGFFETLGIRFVQGRDFAVTDRADAPAVVIVNESMARAFWPGESPLGKRLGSPSPFMSNPRVVVGVVADVDSAGQIGDPDSRFQMYRPLAQMPGSSSTIALRTRTTPEALAPDLRRLVATIDPDQPIYQVTSVRQAVSRGMASLAVAGKALVAFACLGVLLAAIGIYGVIANTVVQRTSEIGLRMALGAEVRDIFTLILGRGLRLTLLGVAIGLGGAYALGRLLGAISPEFAHPDPLLAAGVTALLVFVAMFACWLPARRAARVDPMTALRAE